MDGAAHRFELAAAELAVVVAIEAVEDGARAGRTKATSLRTTRSPERLCSTSRAWATPCPRGSPRTEALAIAGLSVAIAIAISLAGSGAIAVAWAALGALATITRAAVVTSTTFATSTFSTFAGAGSAVTRSTAAARFRPVAARAIAALGIALSTTLFACLARGLAFFFAQLAIAIFVELFQHPPHATARTTRAFAVGALTTGAILPLRHAGHKQHNNWRNGHPDASHLSNLLAVSAPPIAVSWLGPLPNPPLTKGCCLP